MATSGGPKLAGTDRGKGLRAATSITDALCYSGDPTTNASYDSSRGGYTTLSQTYDWNNSGTSSRTNNPEGMPKPPGYEATTVAVCEKKCLTTGSQHMGMGFCDSGISGSTVYTVSLWYRQSRVGVGGPYVRQKDNNNSLGGMEWIGYDGNQAISGTSNWPANEWILLKKTVTTSANETGLYISNYIGSTAGDTIWCFGPQIEAKSYFTPVVLDASGNAATSTRTDVQSLTDLSSQDNTNTLNGPVIGRNHFKNGYTIALASSSEPTQPCLDFDGSDDYIQVPDNSAFLTSKTWELWINFDAFPSNSSFDSVFQKSPNWNTANTIGMNLIYGNFNWSFGHHWGGAAFDALSNLSVGVWYHAVGTVDMADPTMTSRTYLNGVAKGTQTNPYTDRPTNTNVLQIGTGSGGPFNGQIAVFNVYQEELTAAQVLYNFNSMRSRFNV